MRRHHRLVPLLAVLALACDTGPIAYGRLVPDFPKHRTALIIITDGLLSLRAVEDVSGFVVREDGHVTFLTREDRMVDSAAVLRGTPDSLKPIIRQIAALAPQLVLGGNVERDSVVILSTGSGGATGPGWGYVRVGTGGVGKLREVFHADLESIPHETEWFAFSVD